MRRYQGLFLGTDASSKISILRWVGLKLHTIAVFCGYPTKLTFKVLTSLQKRADGDHTSLLAHACGATRQYSRISRMLSRQLPSKFNIRYTRYTRYTKRLRQECSASRLLTCVRVASKDNACRLPRDGTKINASQHLPPQPQSWLTLMCCMTRCGSTYGS